MKSCKNCEHYKRLYDTACFVYSKQKIFYCTALEKLAEPQNTCESWQRKNKFFDLSAERFGEAKKDLEYILNFYKTIE